MPATSVPSPCVRNCCLDDGDICLGCHRSLAEIVSWSGMSEEQKRSTLHLAEVRGKQYQAGIKKGLQ